MDVDHAARPVRPYVISNPAIRYPAVPALTVAQIRAHLLARHRTENGGFERIARSACRHVGSRDGRTGPTRR